MTGRSERTELSAERLELIHRFMSERPEDKEGDESIDSGARAVRDEAPASPLSAPSSPAPSLAPVPHLAPVVRMPRRGELRGGRLQVAVVSMRSPVELAWPIAAVILALLVGVLIAH